MSDKVPSGLSRAVLGRARMEGQGLTGATAEASVEGVCRRVLGLQAQSWPAAVLSVRPRSRRLTSGDVEAARQAERSVVRTWAMRGTLFLLAAEDVRPLMALLGARQLAKRDRRHSQVGLGGGSLERVVPVLVRALGMNGPMTRSEIGEELVARGALPRIEDQALPHIVGATALAGLTCHGPLRGKAETYVLLDDWIGARARLLILRSRFSASQV